ncbi:MAG TPA: proline--tRNA ligase [Spirochaetota bacterium]|nr:proline--tRNA ligase [Spirochaetota bacterium]HOH36407.1 proline--tRNA ligase [Spirochaetota bacterium]HPY03916.1 proline--tRNA ligase [Spirochaetota bacterium]HQA51555.1 proline--tRNA ligase [Spirochaetota bacterium]
MRYSRYLIPTMKEDPSDAVVSSHRLMMRAGLVRKESAGMYVYLPLGHKALRKIINIVREEMDNSGALEFLMPELTNADLWKESGRWNTMGPEMFRIKDRNNLEYALGPTHEEAFTNAVRSTVTSYKELPINAYQINTKFRDEIRPRFGVIRSKEFIMKDAYSFDVDEEGLDKSYQTMRSVYRKIFDRCGLATIPVQADTGNMGGSASEEFMVASEVGEETLLICGACSYRANQEKAVFKREEKTGSVSGELEKVHTPDVKTIDDLAKFFSTDADKFLKSILYTADGETVMAVVTGDREINEIKLKNYLGCVELELASDDKIFEATKSPVGFAGPIGINGVRIVFDLSVKNTFDAITGANEKDYHYKGVNPGRDFEIKEEADLVTAVEGDACPECGKKLSATKGIEVGHIFKLGYKYTKAMNFTFLDKNGRPANPIMGCYGVGVTRTLAAVIEQNHDEKGLMWPKEIAPFDVHIVGICKTEEDEKKIAEIYEEIKKAGFDALYDDRKNSPGIKFADADLIGLPLRITVGKSFFDTGDIEALDRKTKEIKRLQRKELVPYLKEFFGR